MTAALMGRHSLDRTPDGLVTTFTGDLTPDMPTQLIPAIGDESTDRLWLPVLDEVDQILHGVDPPPDQPRRGSWAPVTTGLLEKVKAGLERLLEE